MSSKHTLLTRSVLAALISGSLVACGGSSSDDSGGGEPPETASYLVSTEVTTGGSLDPDQQTVDEGDSADFTVTITDGFTLEAISGCNGSLDGATYTTGAITADCTVSAEFEPIPNEAPTVSATAEPEEVMETETATMNANASDSDGEVANYQWVQTSGDVEVTLEGADSEQCSFVAPDVSADTPVTFEVTVTDDDGDTATSEVSLTITNTPAQAVINSDVTEIDELDSLTLEADTNTGWSYSWAQTAGPEGEFSSTTDALTEYTAPEVNANETVTLELTVTDDKGRTDSAQHDLLVVDLDFSIAWQSKASAAAGSNVVLELTRDVRSSDVVLFSGAEIAPTSIDGNQLTFTVPDESSSGSLVVQGETKDSNSVWLEIGETGLTNAHPDSVFDSTLGEQVVSDFLIVSLVDGSDDATAEEVAATVGGTVLGYDSTLGVYQIGVSADNYAELESQLQTLQGHTAVVSAMMDPIIEDEAIDWSGDPAIGEQRDRNNVQAGAETYQAAVGTDITPMFMALGVSEAGVDYTQVDFDGFAGAESGHPKMTLHSPSVAVDAGGSHGTNVTGLIAGELGDGGNAGLLSALADNHGGAAVLVNSGSSSLVGRLSSTMSMARAGASVINWSWGIHRLVAEDSNEDGTISNDEITDGAMTCADSYTRNNVVNQRQFDGVKSLLTNFFNEFRENHPQTVIVTSAGNGATDAGDFDNRLPSSFDSNQLVVVGAHTSGGLYSDGRSEDEEAASGYETSCFDTSISTDVKRAHYSNYGETVDITASGTIAGWDGSDVVSHRGTSYAVPMVAATVALVQSIDPTLTPVQIKQLLRASALPIENTLAGATTTNVVTRELTVDENPSAAGSGARLNVAGAIEAAVTRYDEGSGSVGEPISVGVGDGPVVETVTFTVPEDNVYDAVDIFFTVDVSGSYYDDLSTFRTQATALIDEFLSAGRDVQIGLSSFSEFPGYGGADSTDYPFRLDLPLTNQSDNLIAALDELMIEFGGDSQESQYEALYQTASRESGWREGALPIIFLATDAPFHDADNESDYPGPGRTATLQRLQDNDIRVYGLQSGGTIDEVLDVTEVTGGEAFLLSRNSSEIVDAVIEAIDSTTQNLSLNLEPFGDFAGLVEKVVPTDSPDANNGQPIEGVQPGDQVSFDVTFNGDGIPTGETVSFSFRLRIVVGGAAVIHEIPVIVTIEG
ncbi:PKD domain-containing protein [Idiomarina seosinensis]|uniref:VWFA domain-containing protein n=1 Tax=Idiomarina seosinensis TaxID=281739 RepID=A0A432ZG82_9GAMM|nr:S8 family serine peptidase [Idiomarina seosinensis]RUO76978.1 hypothetical protein CWI81_00270 [Idiomarina seosinensis]